MNSQNNYILKLNDVSKKFDDLSVLSNITFEVEIGKTISILGPSGCGKTTLLKIIGQLEMQTAGKIIYNNDMTIKSSFVFQEPALLPWQTLKQNVELPIIIQGKPIDNKKVNYIINLVGLQNFKDYYPSKLSGGMKHRTALARALITQPNLLLLDEPFSSLDEFNREVLYNELNSILNKLKTTTILVTHNIREAIVLSDLIIILSDRPASIIKKVHNPFAKQEKDVDRMSDKYLELERTIRENIIL
jgi:NitT/TauT family transport system ATP-binding protein